MHVDDFVHGEFGKEKYARWFFFLHRLPAVLQGDFREWISQYKLFCTYKEKEYRVTGASRLGDVWLAEDFKREVGYDLRVDIEDCTNWSNQEGEHDEKRNDSSRSKGSSRTDSTSNESGNEE